MDVGLVVGLHFLYQFFCGRLNYFFYLFPITPVCNTFYRVVEVLETVDVQREFLLFASDVFDEYIFRLRQAFTMISDR